MQPVVDSLVYGLFRLVQLPLRALPEWTLPRVSRALSALFCRAMPSRYRVALSNIQLALPQLSPDRQQQLARESITQFIQTAIEFVRLRDYTRRVDEIVAPDDLRPLQEARSAGRGVIVLVAHFGLWDLGGGWLSHHGYPVHAIARVMDNPRVDRYVAAVRESLGTRTLPHENAITQILRHLRAGDVVAILADQHSNTSSVVVPFFGQPASTVRSVARLALATNAAIIPMSVIRTAPMRHRMRIYPQVTAEPSGDKERDIINLTAAVNVAYESMILEQPAHWMWIHRRWKDLDQLLRQQAREAERRMQEAGTR